MMSRLAGCRSSRVGLQRRLVDDRAGELVDREELCSEQREQRAEIDDAEPEQRRREQEQQQEQPRRATSTSEIARRSRVFRRAADESLVMSAP